MRSTNLKPFAKVAAIVILGALPARARVLPGGAPAPTPVPTRTPTPTPTPRATPAPTRTPTPAGTPAPVPGATVVMPGAALDITGDVVKVESNRRFTLRDAKGIIYSINSDENLPREVRAGERIQVRGYGDKADSGVLEADHVYVTGRPIDVTGQITTIESATRLRLRDDNRTTYYVNLRRNLPQALGAGELIQVRGTLLVDNIINAQNVYITGTRIDLIGTVVSIASNTRLTVRDDGGTTFDVNYPRRLLATIRTGDRVQVRGLEYADEQVTARYINLLGSRFDFTGTVVRVAGDDQLTVRDDHGTQFFVNCRDRLPTLRSGDRVRLYGLQSAGDNISCDRVYNAGNGPELGGAVIAIQSPTQMTVRTDDGQTVTVVSGAPLPPLRAGDWVDLIDARQNGEAFTVQTVERGENRLDLAGTLVAIQSATQATVRDENGVSVTVNTREPLPALRVGDRVLVRGIDRPGDFITAQNIEWRPVYRRRDSTAASN